MTAKKAGTQKKAAGVLSGEPAKVKGGVDAESLSAPVRATRPSPAYGESRPDFESAARTVPGEPKKEQRGGLRPGAGRPQGVTDDLAAVNKLPEKPNLLLVPVLKMPFKFWARAIRVSEMALSKDEGADLALPVTQLLEFYFPGKIPAIAWAWLMLAAATEEIMDKRFDILAQKREQKQRIPWKRSRRRPSRSFKNERTKMKVTIINSENLKVLVNNLHEWIAQHNRTVHVLEMERIKRAQDNIGGGDTLSEMQEHRAQVAALRLALGEIERFATEIDL